MSEKYGQVGQLKAQLGKGDQLADILLRASELVSTLDGCLVYSVGLDQQDADTVCIMEVWRSKEDHAASLTLPAVRALIQEAMPLLAAPPSGGMEINVLDGHITNE